jgi:hypothetical protein
MEAPNVPLQEASDHHDLLAVDVALRLFPLCLACSRSWWFHGRGASFGSKIGLAHAQVDLLVRLPSGVD